MTGKYVPPHLRKQTKIPVSDTKARHNRLSGEPLSPKLDNVSNHELKIEFPSKNAYVMCMFKSDGYLPGVFVMVESIRKNTEKKYDIVCMVTNDVSDMAKRMMLAFNIKVLVVDYIETTDFNRPCLLKRYPSIHKFFTKWNCLRLTQYNKILFLDIDMVVVGNIDPIFKINTPATRLILNDNIYKSGEKQLIAKMITPDLVDGDSVPSLITKEVLFEYGGSIDGGCMLLTPNIDDFKNYIVYLKTFDPESKHYDLKAIPGDDELTLLHFYYKKGTLWNFLDIQWSFIQYHYGDLPYAIALQDNNSIKILNFIGIYKPWDYNLQTLYPDTSEWYKYWNGVVLKNYNHLASQLTPLIKTGFPLKYEEPYHVSKEVLLQKKNKKIWYFNSLRDGKTHPPYNDMLSPSELKLWEHTPLRSLNKVRGHSSKSNKKKSNKKKSIKKKSIKKKKIRQ